jgi:hypothetical protein
MNDFFNYAWKYTLEQTKIVFTPEVGAQAIIVMGSALLAFILARIIKSAIFPHLGQRWGKDSLWFSLADKID